MTEKEYYEWQYRQMMERQGCWSPMMMACLIVAVLLMLCGCRTQYVPVPEYHTEYVYRTDSVMLRDSIWQHDSIYVSMKGDTVTVEKWRTKYVEHLRDVVRIDSFIKTDSIRVPYPVERKLSRWEQLCVDYGKVMIGVTAAVLIALAVVIVIWIRRRFAVRT